jgi:ATP-dependent DNA ligase
VFAFVCRLGAEGIVSKRVDGTNRSGRCTIWIKAQSRQRRCAGGQRELE